MKEQTKQYFVFMCCSMLLLILFLGFDFIAQKKSVCANNGSISASWQAVLPDKEVHYTMQEDENAYKIKFFYTDNNSQTDSLSYLEVFNKKTNISEQYIFSEKHCNYTRLESPKPFFYPLENKTCVSETDRFIQNVSEKIDKTQLQSPKMNCTVAEQ